MHIQAITFLGFPPLPQLSQRCSHYNAPLVPSAANPCALQDAAAKPSHDRHAPVHHIPRYDTAPLLSTASSPRRSVSLKPPRLSLPSPGEQVSRSAESSPIASVGSSEEENLTDSSQCSTPKLESRSRASKNWNVAARLVMAYRTFSSRGRYPWVQLAGHADGFRESDSDDWILKLCTTTEQIALEEAAQQGLR